MKSANNAKTPGQLLSSPLATATVTVTIEGAADAPTDVDAGGPYSTTEGQQVSFNASFDDPDIGDTHTFEWTVGGQVVSTEQNPTVDWADLVAVGGDDGPGTFDVVFTVTDGGGLSDSAMTTLDIANAPPVAAIMGDPETDPPATEAVLGIPVTFNFLADDPSGTDQAAGFSYDISCACQLFDPTTGDPIASPITSASPLAVDVEFQNFGMQTITVTATDKDGGVSPVATHDVDVVPVALVNGDLQATGTPGADVIIFYPVQEGIQVRYNNVFYPIGGGGYSVTGNIVANGEGGSDRIVIANRVLVPAVMDGGPGNDYLAGGVADDTMYGGDGSDIILLGEGDNFADGGGDNDRIEGRTGVDVFFGGDGNDRLNGVGGDDILDGGSGNDVLFGGLGNDLLAGGDGSDTVNGHFGNDAILGGGGSDQLFGSAGQDLLIGGEGRDRLRGDAGDDDLIGGATDLDAAIEADLADLLSSGALSAAVEAALGAWFSSGNDRSGFGNESNDGATDALTGGSGFDEFSQFDSAMDFRSGEGFI